MRRRPLASGFRITRTRALAYALLAFCALLVLFGPEVADRGLDLLGCRSGAGPSDPSCGFISGRLAVVLVPWLSAQPPIDTAFLLLERGWWLLAAWATLIVLSARAERNKAAQPDIVAPNPVPPVAAMASGFRERQAQWLQARQAEQQAEAESEQRSLSRRLFAEGVLWGSVAVTCWALLAGLIFFCFAFGTPLLGGLSAQALLSDLGCSSHAPSSHLFAGSCDFWLDRLAPWRQPFIGALLSPIWLFTQFHDLLLAWLGLILLLVLLPIYRFGWMALVASEHAIMSRLVFALFALSSIGLLYAQFFPLPR